MEQDITFKAGQFSRIFPFYILINKDLLIESTGKTLEKIYPGVAGHSFTTHFAIIRPHPVTLTFAAFQSLTNQMVTIECHNEQHITLRGQLEWIESNESLLFIGSPWFDSMEEVIKNNLSLHDFAFHDPMIDLLHVLKTQEITTHDLKHLLTTVNKQRNELKKAAKEIQDIALFSTQNPDPHIRIDLAGNILRRNPSAEKLTHFTLGNEDYSADGFWKHIAPDLDLSKERIILEASSQGEIYSFVIKPLPTSGYFNIYGRKITEQKKDQLQLQILSSIAAENTHGVVIADKEGRIEWANKSFETMTGYTLDEMKGKKPGQLLQGPETNPDMVRYLSNQIRKGEPFTCEILNYNKSNKPYWLRIQGQALRDENGNITKYFAVEQDITLERETQEKLKDFESRFRLALEKIGDYVWEHNFSTGNNKFSRRENHFIGVSTDSIEENEKLWRNSVLEPDRHLLEENDKNYRNGRIDSHALEYRMLHPDGSVKWVLDRGVVIEKDGAGNPLIVIGTHTDITRQKTLELELGATANRLSSLIKNLNSGVLLENENRAIGLVNQQFCNLFQMPLGPEQLIGINCADVANQAEHLFKNSESFVARINELLEEKKLVAGELMEMVDGKFLQRDFIPIWNEGKYSGHLWVYNDITEKVQADRKLEEQRLFYEDILDNIPADVAVFDNERRYLYVNPRAIKDKEIRKWIIGKNDAEYLRYRNKPMELLESRNRVHNMVQQTKELHSWEEEFKMPDGSSSYVLRHLYPVLNENNAVELVIGYGVDITERKQFEEALRKNEEKYRGIIANMNLGLLEIDLHQRISFANQSLLSMTNATLDEVMGSPINRILPLWNQQAIKHNREDRRKGISEALEVQVEVDNQSIWWLVSSAPKFDDKGNCIGSIIICLDINERKELEQQLIVARERAEQLAKTKENFLANMSHEIRTPMNAIMGMSSQLAKTNLSGQQRFFLSTIHTASENLLVIVNDILDLSKIDAGKLSIEEIGFELKKVVDGAMQVLLHKAEEKGLRLTNSFYDTTLAKVLIGDPYRLNQILLNLMSNAIKFTEKGSVDVICDVRSVDADSQVVSIRVIDTGMGMDSEFLKDLFQKFNQEYKSVSRRFGGTGLGMVITRQLVELMGGTILVSSKKEKGTTVTFDIPFKKGTLNDLPGPEIQRINTDILKDKKILVVDDNDMNRLVAATMLEHYKADILEAENGLEAIERIRELKPNIVLMDLQMPVLNGMDATQLIRQSGVETPIIALTANAIKGESEKCFAAGMNDYISKPYTEDQLLQILVKWLRHTNQSPEESPTEEKTPSLIEPLYDLTGLAEISRGNQAFVSKMVKLFCEQTPVSVKEMEEAFAAGNLEKMGALAHKMKPGIDNLRIESLKQVIRSIEKAGKENNAHAQLSQWLHIVSETIEQVVKTMRAQQLI